jgi:hypothetical protein
LKKFIKDESGSISLLLVFLFLVTAIISLVVIDISDSYLAKRQLAQVGEAAAQIGSHQIDLNRYYSQGLIDSGMGYKQVPLDCNRLTGASCQNEKVTLNIQSEIRPLITLPIVTGTFGQRFLINSQVITTAVVR